MLPIDWFAPMSPDSDIFWSAPYWSCCGNEVAPYKSIRRIKFVSYLNATIYFKYIRNRIVYLIGIVWWVMWIGGHVTDIHSHSWQREQTGNIQTTWVHWSGCRSAQGQTRLWKIWKICINYMEKKICVRTKCLTIQKKNWRFLHKLRNQSRLNVILKCYHAAQ